MRHGRAGVMIGTALGAVFTFTACSNDPSKLYCEPGECASDDAGGTPRAMPPEEPPWLPALPDEDVRAACAACAKEECVQARSNCLEDDACTALLQCKGECEDPSCMSECEAEHGFSAWYEDFWACVLNDSCSTECQSGENWGCVERYDWRPAEDNAFQVEFRFENPRTAAFLAGESRMEAFWAGAEVRTCLAADAPCTLSNRIDSGRVDAANHVELEVRVPAFAETFGGMLEIESETVGALGLKERLLPLPLRRAGPMRVLLLDRQFVQNLSAGAVNVDTDASLAALIVDCLTVQARGVRLEIPDLDDMISNDGQGDFGHTDLGYVLVPDIPSPQREGWVTVQVVRVDTDDPVAERGAFVRAGWTTHLELYPSPR